MGRVINNYFLEENQILNNIDSIQEISGHIIHGRYDVISPLKTAWDLHSLWPNSEFYIVRDAGHSITKSSLIDTTMLTIKKIADRHS